MWHTLLSLCHTLLSLCHTLLSLCHTHLSLCHTLLSLCHILLLATPTWYYMMLKNGTKVKDIKKMECKTDKESDVVQTTTKGGGRLIIYVEFKCLLLH